MESLLNRLAPDRYDRQARLKPALLVLLPALVMAAVWLPDVWTVLGGVATLLGACGLTFFLARLARFRGRAVEKQLHRTYGTRFTTVFLRHRDATISAVTKERYHAFPSKQGLPIPSATAEADDPAHADACYQAGVDWLLERTRDDRKYPLIKTDNIDYGFRRNLLGLKPLGLTILLTCLGGNIWLAWLNFQVDETRFWTAAVLAGAMALAALAWLLWVRLEFVADAGRSYAVRLLAQCEVLDKPAPRKRKTQPV